MDDNTQTNFGSRLKFAMIRAGLTSNRSPSGVNIQKLSEITGNSLQICRKYLHDQSIPGIDTIVAIADILDVVPGWLLFGDNNKSTCDSNYITISKALLHYIFKQYFKISPLLPFQENLTTFLFNLTTHTAELDLDEAPSKKIIDFSIEQYLNSQINPER